MHGQVHKKPISKIINIKQKHAARIIFNEDRLYHSRPLSKTLNALNVYQLNIYQNLTFMHRLKNDNIPKIFTELMKKPKHKYPTNFSKNSYATKSFSLSNMKYFISIEDQNYGMTFCKTSKRKFNPTDFFKKL